MFETVLVGADDSQTARRAVLAAVDVAKITGSELHIVTAYDPKAVKAPEVLPEFRQTTLHPADALLASLTEIATQQGLKTVVHAAAGDAADAIVKIAEDVNADLIVIGNRGMKGVRRVLGSVPNSVAHKAHCSVLIVDTHLGDDDEGGV